MNDIRNTAYTKHSRQQAVESMNDAKVPRVEEPAEGEQREDGLVALGYHRRGYRCICPTASLLHEAVFICLGFAHQFKRIIDGKRKQNIQCVS